MVGSVRAGMFWKETLLFPFFFFEHFGGMIATGVPIPEPSAIWYCDSTVTEELGRVQIAKDSQLVCRACGCRLT